MRFRRLWKGEAVWVNSFFDKLLIWIKKSPEYQILRDYGKLIA